MPEPSQADVLAAYRRMADDVDAAVRAAGRANDAVTLVAVSKTHGPDRLIPVLDAGHRVFGENRVHEAQGKWPALKAAYPDTLLHLIGPLQTNKVKDALGLFDVIETVDRPRLADALAEGMIKVSRFVPCLVQVNIGDEPQKSGVALAEAEAFIEYCRPRLPLVGLMCIPPVGTDPLPHFRRLAGLAADHGLKRLSMGMSGDYAQAIAAGATHVRVGTAIFGTRAVEEVER